MKIGDISIFSEVTRLRASQRHGGAWLFYLKLQEKFSVENLSIIIMNNDGATGASRVSKDPRLRESMAVDRHPVLP
jgi:hypothetical protein